MISGFDGKCLQQRFVLLKNLKTSENGWRKVKNSFHVKEIHRVTLHLASSALKICVSLHNSIVNLILI